MEELNIKKISFSKRPIPIPAEYRPIFKMAMIVLILKYCCRANKSSLLKLHLFSWALSSKKHMQLLRTYVHNGYKGEFSIWGIEPALNRALQFATAEKICELVDGKSYVLKDDMGMEFYKKIAADKELFADEKEFLSSFGKNKITDSRINDMTKQWSLFYAEN